MNTLVSAALLVLAKDPVPADNDVKAGWTGFAVFVLLILAVALLLWSLTRHLRKVRDNAASGVFGPVETDAPAPQDPPATR